MGFEGDQKFFRQEFERTVLGTSRRMAKLRATRMAIDLIDDVAPSQSPDPLTDGPGLSLVEFEQKRIVNRWVDRFLNKVLP